jgi:hypothetical protein
MFNRPPLTRYPHISGSDLSVFRVVRFCVPVRDVKPDHKNKKPRHVAENHETNFFHIKFLDRTNIKCQHGPELPPAQVFYFNGQALPSVTRIHTYQRNRYQCNRFLFDTHTSR